MVIEQIQMNTFSVADKYKIENKTDDGSDDDKHNDTPAFGINPNFFTGGAKKAASTVESGSTADILGKAVFRKRKTMAELIIDAPLTGVVSLSFLEKSGFNDVVTVRFAPGQMTELVDVPQTVRRIFAANNQLTTIDGFPIGVEHLEVNNNQIGGTVNVARYDMLTHLNVAHNQITGFIGHRSSSSNTTNKVDAQLPGSLIDLIANHNQISSIRLNHVPLLQTLDLEYNPEMTVHDLPDGITNLTLPAVYTHQSAASVPAPLPGTEIGRSTAPPADTTAYREALVSFYRTRKAYETGVAKNNKSGKLPPCPGCGRTGGIVFSSRNQKHRAYCGNSPPCDWHITVSRGEFHPVREVMHGHAQNLETTRNHIIRQKMDTLFEYITEEKSAELFTLQMEYYREASKLATQYTNAWNAAFWNEAKAAIIHQKQKQVQVFLAEAEQAAGQKNWAEAARIQTNQVAPLARYIQSLMYESTTSEMLKDGTVLITQLAVTPERAEVNIGHTVGVISK